MRKPKIIVEDLTYKSDAGLGMRTFPMSAYRRHAFAYGITEEGVVFNREYKPIDLETGKVDTKFPGILTAKRYFYKDIDTKDEAKLVVRLANVMHALARGEQPE